MIPQDSEVHSDEPHGHEAEGAGQGWLPQVDVSRIWVCPKIGVPQNGWFIMENPIQMDDLGVPLFSETSIWP